MSEGVFGCFSEECKRPPGHDLSDFRVGVSLRRSSRQWLWSPFTLLSFMDRCGARWRVDSHHAGTRCRTQNKLLWGLVSRERRTADVDDNLRQNHAVGHLIWYHGRAQQALVGCACRRGRRLDAWISSRNNVCGSRPWAGFQGSDARW